jgi:hypothetical protein
MKNIVILTCLRVKVWTRELPRIKEEGQPLCYNVRYEAVVALGTWTWTWGKPTSNHSRTTG